MTTARDITIYQGQAFALSLDYAGTAGRGQRMHIRLADSTATVVQILTHNGDANARVIFDTDALEITIGASVSAGWVVLADRVEWVYDIEDYDLADEDDTVIPYRGKVIVRGNRTRPEDATLSPQMPNGDSRYTRFDGDQNLTPEQMAQAQINILGEEYAPGGGSGDVVGPASATDDRIAAFDSTTGKLIKQGSVTATAVASHLGSTSNPHSVTAAQVGADATGTAAAAVVAHAGATDPHGDRAYADGLAGNYATAGHNHSGVYQPLATVLTNTTAAFTTAQETKLSGIETAADVTDAGNIGTAIDGATAKTTPVDADTVPLIDSAASNALKKLSWANIKATAKAYFDTLYQAASATLTTWAGITPGTGVGTALAANVGSAGAVVTNGGALGTPSSGTLTNCSGYPAASTTASGIVELAIASEVSAGTDTTRAMTVDSYKKSTPYYVDRAADWTLALTDVNADQWFNNGASALVCTIPLNATVAFAVGDTIPFVRLASGTATIDAATSVTLNGVSGGSCTISTRYQGALLKKIATDSWVVSGDVSAVA